MAARPAPSGTAGPPPCITPPDRRTGQTRPASPGAGRPRKRREQMNTPLDIWIRWRTDPNAAIPLGWPGAANAGARSVVDLQAPRYGRSSRQPPAMAAVGPVVGAGGSIPPSGPGSPRRRRGRAGSRLAGHREPRTQPPDRIRARCRTRGRCDGPDPSRCSPVHLRGSQSCGLIRTAWAAGSRGNGTGAAPG